MSAPLLPRRRPRPGPPPLPLPLLPQGNRCCIVNSSDEVIRILFWNESKTMEQPAFEESIPSRKSYELDITKALDLCEKQLSFKSRQAAKEERKFKAIASSKDNLLYLTNHLLQTNSTITINLCSEHPVIFEARNLAPPPPAP